MRFRFDLRDGVPLLVRPIGPDDKDLLARGFDELSPQSRYRRFFRQIDRLSDEDLRYLTEVDGVTHSALICVRADSLDEGVGVARWVRLAGQPDVAESAVTVIDRYQDKGVGKTLLYLLARDAIAKDVRAFKAWVVGENSPMLGLLRDLGAEMGPWEHGTMELTIPLPRTVEEHDATAAPVILKAVAAGDLEAFVSEQVHGTVLRARPRPTVH